MNYVILLGLVLLGSPSEAEVPLTAPELSPCEESFVSNYQPCTYGAPERSTRQVLASLQYVEEEDLIELGFDPRDYLPENFDPHTAYVNLEDFHYEQAVEEAPIDIDEALLPDGFDPYDAPSNVMAISFIDLEKEENLLYPEVDTTSYLPEEYDPHARGYVIVAQQFDDGLVIIKATLPTRG